jgi:penicillin V acylase-like amidase (Ntn superfamily)
MILYNVTVNVPSEIADEWLGWMKDEHIPEVMATGKFTEFKIFKLLTDVPNNEGLNFAIQYFCASMSDYEHYQETYAPALQAKHHNRYGNVCYAFRTLLELV